MGSFSIWHWLIVLVIVALIFGTKRLRNIGEDVGGAVKSFRTAMQNNDKPDATVKVQPVMLEKPVDPGVENAASGERGPQHLVS